VELPRRARLVLGLGNEELPASGLPGSSSGRVSCTHFITRETRTRPNKAQNDSACSIYLVCKIPCKAGHQFSFQGLHVKLRALPAAVALRRQSACRLPQRSAGRQRHHSHARGGTGRQVARCLHIITQGTLKPIHLRPAVLVHHLHAAAVCGQRFCISLNSHGVSRYKEVLSGKDLRPLKFATPLHIRLRFHRMHCRPAYLVYQSCSRPWF
jgi:hypothetical protein